MLTLLLYVAIAAGWLLCAWTALTAVIACFALGCALKHRYDDLLFLEERDPDILVFATVPLSEMFVMTFRGWLVQALSPTAYLYMLVIVWFARLDDEPSEGQWPQAGTLVRRPRLPAWAHWADTPDERGFGLYEPDVMRIYLKYGWRVCLYNWLGVRNQLHGLAWLWGQPASEPLDLNKPTETQWRMQANIWQFEQVIGGWRLLLGNKVYSNPYNYGTGSPYWAVPTVTIKKAIPIGVQA